MAEQFKKFLRLKKVLEATGISRSQLYFLEKNGKFPARVSLGGVRAVGWVESEVGDWIDSRIKASRQATK